MQREYTERAKTFFHKSIVRNETLHKLLARELSGREQSAEQISGL